VTTLADPPRPQARTAWLVAGIALLAINLRPAVVAVSPLTARVRAQTGLSAAGVSLLTTLPLLCFGLFAVLAPRLGRRVGLERALAFAVMTLVAGIALRLVPGTGPLFAGSALAGAGIAVENVLLSGLVKRDFPQRTGLMMGLYSVMLSSGAAGAAGLTVPLGDALHAGWRPTLALWGIPAAVALAVWLPVAARSRTPPPAAAAAAVHELAAHVWRSPLAWWIAVYMAGQSLVFYSLNAWLPTLLQDHGIGATTAGGMLAVFNFTGIATALTVPAFATRRANQRGAVALVAGAFGTGLLGLLIAPHAGAWAWMVLLGIAQGAGISLGLTLFVLRTRSAAASAELSGMAQTVGYLIAALGPLTVGALHGATGGWTAGLLELLAVAAVILVAGWSAAADRTLETAAPAPGDRGRPRARDESGGGRSAR
jgi:CP family cyanate transporter-like MFS transporter